MSEGMNKPSRPPRLFQGITRNVLILGLVSFLTDVSSEMIYPLLPMFLTAVLGAGPAFLGLIEGAAESVAAFMKLASGVWADRIRDRAKLVLAGYSLSSFSRPLIAAVTSPVGVLAVRVTDRAGKGIRTSPRDAIIADSVAQSVRGKAYGFHRAMDHAGAVAGPLIATGLLAWFIKDLRTLFWWASVPGILAVLLVLVGVKEVRSRIPDRGEDSLFLPQLPTGPLRTYLLTLLLFTLGNSSDAFLLLRAGQLGVPVIGLPLLWVMFHVVKMLAVMPFGALSDRVGRRWVIIAGWIVYALAYAGFASATTAWQAWYLFGLYGLFYGLTEGVERALLVDLAPSRQRGTAFGWYNFVIGIGALPASVLFGILWQRLGPQAAFGFGAALAAASAFLLLALVRPPTAHHAALGTT